MSATTIAAMATHRVARRQPPARAIPGKSKDATTPPSGTPVCRIPNAVPRRLGANQWMIVFVQPVAANATPTLAMDNSAVTTGKLVDEDAQNIATSPSAVPVATVLR